MIEKLNIENFMLFEKLEIPTMREEFCEFTEIKKQKALLHTYLAWQKNPGLPMGTAVQANYLNVRSPDAANFENWFKQVFELEN